MWFYYLKYWLRIKLIPVIAGSLRLSGKDWKDIGDKWGKETLLAQAVEIRRGGSVEQNPGGKTIAFVSLGGGYGFLVDVVLAVALRAKGHKVVFYLDDAALPIFEGHRMEEPEKWKYISFSGYIFAEKLLKKLGFKMVRFSKVPLKNIDMESYWHTEESSLLRHYRVGILNDSLPLYKEKSQMVREAIRISASVGIDIADKGFDRVIINHALYSSTGPAREEILKASIPVLTHDRAKRKNCLNFTWDLSSDKWYVGDTWAKIKDTDLTAEQNKQIEDYLASRLMHSDDRFVYNFGKPENKIDLIQRLGLDPGKPIYTLFTNVLWDAASSQREIVFADAINWVVETIAWFKDHPEKQLLLKIHPAEVVIGTKQPFMDVINAHLSDIPANVRIVLPTETINSWSVYDITTLGIVHTTTAGMELPLVGKPCLVVSDTHYRGKGFTIDVSNKNEYFSILKDFNPDDVAVEQNRKLALRYSHLLFIRYQYNFPFFYEPSELNVRAFAFADGTELARHSQMRPILDAIDQKSPVLMDN